MQGLDRSRRGRLDRVGHGDDGRKPAVDRSVEGRLALVSQTRSDRRERRHVQAEFDHVAVGADLNALALDLGPDAEAGHGFEV
ncbi:hypothetical protein D3C77_513030 [compost metagenome]